ncbi:hypothetical protein P7K49_003631 [Saguinus oedipus]|uniref:Uncharacterized protein n=1 Tax=Saguinus oedipus TaxID=9490 RepID=A0ABQ9W5V0_SAGOE|nr:hypothetical protein P7K49_003631 [Saguinus oedipus]
MKAEHMQLARSYLKALQDAGMREPGEPMLFPPPPGDRKLAVRHHEVQLQLSAESVGEVYIKSTETGQYLAMDTDGLLYGSITGDGFEGFGVEAPTAAWGYR